MSKAYHAPRWIFTSHLRATEWRKIELTLVLIRCQMGLTLISTVDQRDRSSRRAGPVCAAGGSVALVNRPVIRVALQWQYGGSSCAD